jgi:hypothetical protein
MTSLLLVGLMALAPGDLVLSELMYNADGATLGDDDDMEWIELCNLSGQTQSLQGMMLSDGNNQLFLDGYLLAPGGYVVVPASESLFTEAYGEAVPVVGWDGEWTKMSNGGDEIVLYDSNGIVVDSVAYSDDWGRGEGDADSPADGDGSSLEKVDLAGGGGEENWRPSVDCASPWSGEDGEPVCWGTPGEANSVSGR